MCELDGPHHGWRNKKTQNRFTDECAHVSTNTCAYTSMRRETHNTPTEWFITNPHPTARDLFIRFCVIAAQSHFRRFRTASFGLTASLNRFIGAPGTVILMYLDNGGKWRDTAGVLSGDLQVVTPFA